MEYREFRRHLGKAGLTVNAYADLLHVRPSSISNYAKKGAVPQPHAIIAVLLGEAADRGTDFVRLLSSYGVMPIKTDNSKVTHLQRYLASPHGAGTK